MLNYHTILLRGCISLHRKEPSRCTCRGRHPRHGSILGTLRAAGHGQVERSPNWSRGSPLLALWNHGIIPPKGAWCLHKPPLSHPWGGMARLLGLLPKGDKASATCVSCFDGDPCHPFSHTTHTHTITKLNRRYIGRSTAFCPSALALQAGRDHLLALLYLFIFSLTFITGVLYLGVTTLMRQSHAISA